MLFHSPDLATKNWREQYDAFPWPRLNRAHLETWQRGETGIAVVDAGMKQLWHTGVMHNRVRMVTASFLTKNLLIDWRHGEQWFWDCLVDADAASNPFNWQWVAGSGADAAPYFRVFNPETQREKFDPHDEYIRRWAPEYLDGGAPEPMVDLKETRQRALDAYDKVRHGG
ncbi:deoxyribodipyrimidine photolyase [Microbacterium sp. SLBN-111]